METVRDRGRRQFLKLATGAAVVAISPTAFAAPRIPPPRALSFQHLHTGEHLDIVYWAEGRYQAGAMRHIDWLLRDFRTGQVHRIDPRLLDLLTSMRQRLRTPAPFQVISGYRSPSTNAMLFRATEGVAQHSLHLEGKAIDIRVPGTHLATVHRVAVSLREGGVGYYPESDFVHVDTGRVRYW